MTFVDRLADTLDPPAGSATHLCRNCGTAVVPQVGNRVNPLLAFFLIICLLVPGILYLIWASSQRVYTCPACTAENSLIPLDSPEAKRQLQRY